jgi:hypothetical protein
MKFWSFVISNVLRRKPPKRLVFKNIDRLVFSQCAGRVEDSQTRNSDCVASSWFSSLLALEITITRRPAKRIGGNSQT